MGGRTGDCSAPDAVLDSTVRLPFGTTSQGQAGRGWRGNASDFEPTACSLAPERTVAGGGILPRRTRHPSRPASVVSC